MRPTTQRTLTRLVGCFALLAVAPTRAAPEIPVMPGVTYVIAVSNAPSAQPNAVPNVAQGDYETVVTLTSSTREALTLTAFIDGVDARGVRRQANIPRQVLTEDLARSHLQVLGFHTDDPSVLRGTTSLGPSLELVRELLTTGRSSYSFQNFASQQKVTGQLDRASPARVKFPVLVNGQRVELDALRATASLASGDTTRPFEQIILDHPSHPLSLRIAYGPRGAGFPFVPDFAREIVRIDFPVVPLLDESLTKHCRAEIPGLYFDFNEATLKPNSIPALREIARTLQQHAEWRVSIEGHTDNIGGERYNDDLSLRRANTVKTALEKDLSVRIASLAAKGWGLHRPIESNDTLAGRARNRRVELVRACN
jgi:outer membrane protein OmpA-like peptidoglycan-associated protein